MGNLNSHSGCFEWILVRWPKISQTKPQKIHLKQFQRIASLMSRIESIDKPSNSSNVPLPDRILELQNQQVSFINPHIIFRWPRKSHSAKLAPTFAIFGCSSWCSWERKIRSRWFCKSTQWGAKASGSFKMWHNVLLNIFSTFLENNQHSDCAIAVISRSSWQVGESSFCWSSHWKNVSTTTNSSNHNQSNQNKSNKIKSN